MPKNKQSGTRISSLHFLLTSNNFLTKDQILQKLKNEFDIDVSWETIKKDLQEINLDGKVIDYDPRHGYFLTDKGGYLSQFTYSGEQRKALELASGILAELADIPLLKDFETIIKKLLKVDHANDKLKKYFASILQLETVPKREGIKWISPIFSAIRGSRMITVVYKKFDSPVSKNYLVHPYLLKEYRNRWYLICRNNETSKVVTFALDRVQDIKEEESELVWQNFDPEEYYKYSLGITTYETDEIMEVKLKVTTSQLNYLKTLPLHHSQEIVEGADGSGIVKLKVLYSYELIKEILGMGYEVEVLEPVSLRDEVAERLRKAMENYKVKSEK
jgi:predicted DNA-binding transcriptional regulator YafY